jgi:Flp pilus assembly protein TadD
VLLAAVTFLNFNKPLLVATVPKSVTTLTPEMLAKINEAKKNKTGAVNDAEKNDEDKSDQELEMARLKNSAALHFQSGEWDLSAKDYSQLVNLSPTDPEARNNYGLVLKKWGKKNEAKEQYSLALALKEDYPEALNNMAVMHILDNNLVEAKQLLKKAIELNPDYLDPYLHLALCLEKNGEITLAEEYYKIFLKNSEGKVDRKIRLQIENRLAKLNES